ncbi:MAG: class I tRNA ligase family protein, partial [Candidatus Woesearchaeota archaeon]|nr:class I tRNA ligase family protein [Candidatus Woesearchaeota archaeon]
VPDWAGNRQFDAWLDNLRDNSITKQRFWGTPLPIWRCEKCGNYDVIGSIKELKEKAKKLPKDLHKPWIDEIKYKCSCGGIKKKIPDVIDVWVDAGCTSWICIGYPQKKELFDKMYPPDFILEGKDQIRGWFNLLFVASMVSMQRPSYKAVYMHGWVNDAQGRKMSKSLGNYIIPQEVVDKYGADAFRYYSIGGTNPGLDLNYNFDDVKIKFKNLSVLWNLHNLLLDLHYQGIKTPATAKGIELSVEERYMLSKLHSTIKKATEKFELYYINEIPAIVEELFLDLSRTYIQLVREKLSGTDEEKKTAMYIIYNVLLETLKLFAPVAPFITEKIYQNLRKAFDLKEKSIHLYDWPSYDKKMIDEGLEKDFAILNNILQSIFAAREKSQLGLRWPLKKIYIITKNEDIIKAVKNLEETLKRQANVKEIEIRDLMPYIKRRIKADYATIGPEFGQNSAKVIAQFSIMPAEAIFRRIEENGFYDLNIDGEIFRLKREHLIVEEDMPKNIIKAESKGCDIYLDIERTRELDAEGFAREIIRRTQQLRKEAGLKKPDRISMYIRSDSDMINMIRKWQDNI